MMNVFFGSCQGHNQYDFRTRRWRHQDVQFLWQMWQSQPDDYINRDYVMTMNSFCESCYSQNQNEFWKRRWRQDDKRFMWAVTVTTITKFERGDDVVTRNCFCDQRLLGEEMTSSRATIFATRDFLTRRWRHDNKQILRRRSQFRPERTLNEITSSLWHVSAADVTVTTRKNFEWDHVVTMFPRQLNCHSLGQTKSNCQIQ